MIKKIYPIPPTFTEIQYAKNLSRIEEKGNDPLPMKIVPDPPHITYIAAITARCTALSLQVGISKLKGQPINLDDSIQALLLQLWNHGYNSGLADMDKMHKNTITSATDSCPSPLGEGLG